MQLFQLRSTKRSLPRERAIHIIQLTVFIAVATCLFCSPMMVHGKRWLSYHYSSVTREAVQCCWCKPNTLPSYHWKKSHVLPTIFRSTHGSKLVSRSKKTTFFATSKMLSSSKSDPSLKHLQDEIIALNGGKPLNVNSPKQVAIAIFGSENHSTNRVVLEKAAEGKWPNLFNENSSRLAELILLYRRKSRSSFNNANELDIAVSLQSETMASDEEQAISQTGFANDVSETNFTKVAYFSESKSDEVGKTYSWNSSYALNSKSDVQRLDDPCSYDVLVHSKFSNSRNRVDFYWKHWLLQLTRQSSKTMVSQLDFEQCPMGYDPLAQSSHTYGSMFSPLANGDDENNDGSSVSFLSEKSRSTVAGKKGSFLAYCRDQKEKYPDCIILTRCGDFYETFGIDAVLLVEHCGLNAMAGKAKAGCPVRNVQNTINCLTSAGLRVAVYEEGLDTDSSTGLGAAGGSKSRIKSRFLAQIVSPASPSYLYGLVLTGSQSAMTSEGELVSESTDVLSMSPIARPYVGILSMRNGYTIAEVSVDERTVRVSERLTAEAVACRLTAYPPADPIFYVPSHAEYELYQSSDSNQGMFSYSSLPFLPSRREVASSGPGARIRTKMIPPTVVQESVQGIPEDARAKNIIVSELLKLTESRNTDAAANQSPGCGRQQATVNDFSLVTSTSKSTFNNQITQPNSLHLETAKQLGLMNDQSIPSLLSYLLPASAPVATRRYLRRYLLSPPEPRVGNAMSHLVSFFMDSETSPSLPPFSVPALGKVLALLRAGQANAEVFGDLLTALSSTVIILDLLSSTKNGENVIDGLMTLVEYESGMAAEPLSLRSRCINAAYEIGSVVHPIHHTPYFRCTRNDRYYDDVEKISDFGSLIPKSFFVRNEASWKGRVSKTAIIGSHHNVEDAALQLSHVISEDFWLLKNIDEGCRNNLGRSPVIHDIFNNQLLLKEIPSGISEDNKHNYFHPKDRNGKLLRNRYTTERVQVALAKYVEECSAASVAVSAALVMLSTKLHDDGHFAAIVQASHANLVLCSSFFHAAKAKSLGWALASMFESDHRDDGWGAGHFVGVWPYWMDRVNAVCNSYVLNGLFVLTAPNMSGKSTIMRSSAAASLLTACGLCAPLDSSSKIRRFDHIFVRGASSDIPVEKKSAFGAEMEDISSLLRCCGEKSLVFVDEIGRGTSPFDGTRLAAAILEYMANSGMSGIFATHLHGIFDFPLLSRHRIIPKRMAIIETIARADEVGARWTYTLEDGTCLDSMALETAIQFGLPQEIIEKAQSFSPRPTPSISSNEKEGMDFSQVVRIMQGVTSHKTICIPTGWSVPAVFEGTSSVYVVKVGSDPLSFYVGESDNLRNRIRQHRSKGGDWKDLEVVAAFASSKSEARLWESILIQKFAQTGFNVLSTFDGKSHRW